MKVLALLAPLLLADAFVKNTQKSSKYSVNEAAPCVGVGCVDESKSKFLSLLNSSKSLLNSSKVAQPSESDSVKAALMPQGDLKHADVASAAFHAAITDLMGSKNAFAATPMGGSVEQIKNIITKTMMPKVKGAHRADQARLTSLNRAIKQCGRVKTSQLRRAIAPRNNYNKFSRLHKGCRNQEAQMFSSMRRAEAAKRGAYSVKQLKCKYFAAVSNKYGTQKSNRLAVKKAGSERVEQYIRRLSSTFCGSHQHGHRGQHSRKGGWGGGLKNGMLDKYLKAKDACNKAKGDYSRKVKDHKRKTSQYKNEKRKCNSFQRQMDQNSCSNAVTVKDACEAYAGCYVSKVVEYRDAEGKAAFQERDRKAEWRGLERMACLIGAFEDGKVADDEIDKCKKKTVKTDFLTLKRWKIPRLERCTVPKLYPSTGPYLRKEFAPLPAYAKGKKSAECNGVSEVSLKPARGSPRSCKCRRVTLNGPYSAGALVKCTKCLNIRRSTDKNSCPRGTKIFSPASKTDWQTFISSTGPVRDPHWIVDVTRPSNGCGGCTRYPMNSGVSQQRSWKTSDGSPWWLRSTRYGEPNGDYHKNCYLSIRAARNPNSVTFNDANCNYHSKSYYCQKKRRVIKPAPGSPNSCRCHRVRLSGRYSAGPLVRCTNCLKVSKATQKNSCPRGMKIFSPRSKKDWQVVMDSAGRLAAPHFIVDVTRPRNGCGGCTRYPMKSNQPQQSSWRTSDGSPWWLRDSRYGEPNGNYHANCYLVVHPFPSVNSIRFDDNNCHWHSSSYYCQRKQRKNKGKRKSRRKPKRTPSRKVVRGGVRKGLKEEIWYHKNSVKNIPQAIKGNPSQITRSSSVNVRSTGSPWSGLFQKDRFGVRWTGVMVAPKSGSYTFELTSDDGSKLWINNKQLIDNEGLHGMRKRTGKTNVQKGQNWVRIDYFENGGGAGCIFRYHVPSKGWTYGNLQTPVIKGFKEEAFYTGKGMNKLPGNLGKPSMTRFVGVVNYKSTGGKFSGWSVADLFCGRWTGELQVHRPGRYRWSIISDDGSKLWINNKFIINNDGLHGMRNREANYNVGHKNKIRLEMFENKGGAGIIFRYMGSDTGNKMIVVPQKRMSAI